MTCPKCASQIPDDAKSCPGCGAVLSEQPAAVPPQPQVAPVVVIDTAKHAANQWLRLVNHFIDGVAGVVLALILNFITFPSSAEMLSVSGELAISPARLILPIVLAILFPAIYFIFFESLWQRTPGKWASGTKVVMLDGSRPGFWRIVGRSFARYIPFEFVSYLFGKYPYGWHDALTKTSVVSAAYSSEDVRSIDVHNKGRGSAWIWVLAILAIVLPVVLVIGALSSVVLLSLNTARTAGSDASIKANIANVRYQSELYYDTNQSYEGVCESDRVSPMFNAVRANKTIVTCNDEKEAWAAAVLLSDKMTWCSDSTGYDGYSAELSGSTSCISLLQQGEVNWSVYKSPVHGFSVDLPREPLFNEQTDIALGGGETMDQAFYEAQDETNYYGIVRIEYSFSLDESEPNELLASMLNGTVDSDPTSELVSSKATTHKGDPALDFVISSEEGGVLKGRYVFADVRTIYTLITSHETGNVNEAGQKRFIESFKK